MGICDSRNCLLSDYDHYFFNNFYCDYYIYIINDCDSVTRACVVSDSLLFQLLSKHIVKFQFKIISYTLNLGSAGESVFEILIL